MYTLKLKKNKKQDNYNEHNVPETFKPGEVVCALACAEGSDLVFISLINLITNTDLVRSSFKSNSGVNKNMHSCTLPAETIL